MQFSATALFTAVLALAGTAAAAPGDKVARQNNVQVTLFTAANGGGSAVPVVGPINTPLVLGTNIDNRSSSITVPFGFFVELYDAASGGQCTSLLFTTPLGNNPQDNFNLPANAVNRAGCIRIRPAF